MVSQNFAIEEAKWLAHRYVESEDSVRFIRLPREAHAELPFLTDACLTGSEPTHDLAATECLSALKPAALHFLFHSAFCGSTMFVRALDIPGLSMGLSEPVILNDVVGFRRRGADLRAVARAADLSTRLLARPFGRGEAVVVKPSNVVNPLVALLMTLRSDAKAIFLYAPLPIFLVSVARKGLECRLWVRELAEGYLGDGYLSALGFSPTDLFRQSDLQIAAAGWMAQNLHFQQLATRFGKGRIRMLDSEFLLADPQAALSASARHYGLNLHQDHAALIATGAAFTRHSKTGSAYSREARERDYVAAGAAHGEEIEFVVQWAAKLAETVGIPLAPPAELLLCHS